MFQIGPTVGTNQQAHLGMQSMNTTSLGGTTGTLYDLYSNGSAALATDPTTAAQIVGQAVNQVTSLRGQLGAFQSATLDSNISSLNVRGDQPHQRQEFDLGRRLRRRKRRPDSGPGARAVRHRGVVHCQPRPGRAFWPCCKAILS